MKRRYPILLLVAISVALVNAQNDSVKPSLGVALSLGTAVTDPGSWFFYDGSNNVLVRAGISGDIGIEYGPFPVMSGTHLYVSADLGFVQAQTAQVEFQGIGSEQAKWMVVPALAWARLTTSAVLSPYVQLGVGVINVQFTESHSIFSEYYDTNLKYWTLGWGGGAGLEWRMSDKMRLSLFVTHLSAEGTRTQRRWDGSLNGIYLRQVITPVGLRFATGI